MTKKTTRYAIYRNIILVLAVLITAAIQNTAGTILSSADIGLFLALPLAISIAMFEKEFSGMLYGLLTGAIWDIASPLTDGIFALFFAVTGCLVGLLTRYILRNTIKTDIILSAISITLFCIVSVLFNCLPRDTSGLWDVIKYFYAPSGIITLLLSPISYYFVRHIEKRLRLNAVLQ